MMISIEEDEARFSGRAGAIIYNEDKTKILLENQGRFYRFPGGRIDVHEDSQKAIKRELKSIDISVATPHPMPPKAGIPNFPKINT